MEEIKPQLETAVAIQIFNRPNHQRKVIERIREARPKKFFIIADGPRTEAERALCEQTRREAEEMIDWPCEVYKNYSDRNLGVQERPISGFNWVFEQVDRAIIFDDDCIPDLTFFRYCEELLERYKDDTRIMHISGFNVQRDNPHFFCPDSYYFSVVTQCWGWATWRRAWQYYDRSMQSWPVIKQSGQLRAIYPDPAVYANWELRYDRYYTYEINSSWDGAWNYACITHGGIAIGPKTNLVTNIGRDKSGAHTREEKENLSNLPVVPLTFPLMHPKEVVVNTQADAYLFKYFFNINRYPLQRMRWFLRSHFPALYQILKGLVVGNPE